MRLKDAAQGAGEQHDGDVVGTDVAHVAGEAEQHHDGEADIAHLADEDLLDLDKGVKPAEATALGCRQQRVAQSDGGEHQQQACREQHYLGIVVFGDEIAADDQDQGADNYFQHVSNTLFLM